jgi:uncharacterized protein YdhG (YjbR/CyaY superfamily)
MEVSMTDGEHEIQPVASRRETIAQYDKELHRLFGKRKGLEEFNDELRHLPDRKRDTFAQYDEELHRLFGKRESVAEILQHIHHLFPNA